MNPQERERLPHNPVRREDKFKEIETSVPGVILLAEQGTEPKVPKGRLRKLVGLTRNFFRFDTQEKKTHEQRGGFRKQLIAMAQKIDGFRGLILKKEKARIAIFPSEDVTWDRKTLKDSIGVVYTRVAKEDFILTIHLPIQVGNRYLFAEDIQRAVFKALNNLGIPREAFKTLIEQEIEVTVDEKELEKFQKIKRLKLPKNVKEVKITWNVHPTLLS